MATRPKPPARCISRKPPNKTPPLPAKRNGRALKTGAQASGENLPGYASVRAEIEAVRSEAPWILPTDEPLLTIFLSELTAFRHTADAFTRMGDTARGKKLNAVKLQIRRARVLGELADRLGLSPQSRFKLGLVVAKTEAVKVQPVRSVERARAVAELLQRSSALPPVEESESDVQYAEVVVVPDPEDTPRPPGRRE